MFKTQKVAVDIQDLTNPTIFESLLASGGELFRTSRRRSAILIGQAAFEKLKLRYSLRVEEGQDGTGILKD